VKVTVEVSEFRIEPKPVLSHDPLTVQTPVVRVIVPDVPPFIERLDTPTVEAFAVSAPAFPIINAPPVRPRLLVASVVVPLPL